MVANTYKGIRKPGTSPLYIFKKIERNASSKWKSLNIYDSKGFFCNFDDYPGFQYKITPA